MATPKSGTMMFVSKNGARTVSVDFYVSDVVSAKVRFDDGEGAGASTKEYWPAPFDGFITDWVMSAATGDATTKYLVTINGAPTRDIFRGDVQNASAERPGLRIPVAAAGEISMIQKA
jgi:hypothetical protein